MQLKDHRPHPSSFSKSLASSTTIIALVLAVVAILIPFLLGEPSSEPLEPLIEVGGNLHPLVLHLPIGILSIVMLMEVLGLVSFGRYTPQTTVPLFFGVVSAFVAVLFGYLLYLQGDYQGAKVTNHMWGGIAFTVIAALTYVAKVWSHQNRLWVPFYMVLLPASMGSMTVGAHYGGLMTHGDPLAPLHDSEEEISQVVIPEKVEEREAYAHVIAPLLAAKCTTCHDDKKQKGGLRLDSFAAILEGGSEGPITLIPGDVEKSLLTQYVHLPLEDDLHMPPKSKTQLTEEEVAVLDWWVSSGAPEKDLVKSLEVPEAVFSSLALISTAPAPGGSKEHGSDSHGGGHDGEPLDKEKQKRMLSAINGLGSRYLPMAYVNSFNTHEVSFSAMSLRKSFTDKDLEVIIPLAEGLVDLDLAGTSVTDQSIEILSGMEHLRILSLAETQITDAAMPVISQLSKLERLNLFGVPITDASVDHLLALPHLKKVYLWKTQLSEDGLAKIKESLPECEVVIGSEILNLPKPKSEEEKK